MTNTLLLEAAIARSGLKKAYICKKMGVSATALWSKINNVSEFKASEIEILTQILELSGNDRNAIFFAA